jgi:integral membrane protein
VIGLPLKLRGALHQCAHRKGRLLIRPPPLPFGTQMNRAVHFLRIVALLEAISYMLLVAIAMPLKYIWTQPMAVTVFGSIHGLLFTIFCIALVWATISAKWPLSRAALLFVASLLPFGPFLFDKRMKEWERQS